MLTIFDSFLNNDSEWFIGDRKGLSAHIKNRVYEIDHQNNGDTRIPCEFSFDYDQFFTIDFVFKIIEGNESAYFGLYWIDNLKEHLGWFGVRKDLSSFLIKEVYTPRSSVFVKEGSSNSTNVNTPYKIYPNKPIRLTVCKSGCESVQFGYNQCRLDATLPDLPRYTHMGLYMEGYLKVEVYSFNVILDRRDVPQLMSRPRDPLPIDYVPEKPKEQYHLPIEAISDPDMRREERYQRGEISNGDY